MALPKYHIPGDLEEAIKEFENSSSVEYTDTGNKFLPVLKKLKGIDCLEIAKCHYLQFLKLGLYLEEYQERKDVSKFEIHGSIVERLSYSNDKFKVYMKNLDEDNSALSVFDTLEIYEKSDPDNTYFLKVAKIFKDHIIVIGNKRFCEKYTICAKYSIVLVFNSYAFQCCHYAISVLSLPAISHYCFPEKKSSNSLQLFGKQSWFNSNVFNNPEQNQAVCNIINKSAFPVPYILYGPPGTGKTSTIVEAICQLWKQQSTNRILVCTPSNAASDVITKKLLDYIPAVDMYRMYSSSQAYSSISQDIKKCCNYDSDGVIDDLKKRDYFCKKIIISTLCTSLRLEKLHLRFSHLFIDEAGQTNQAEALIPLCVVKLSLSCQIVLSGDHQQLGPSLRSEFTEPLLGQSILEKLTNDEPYKKHVETGYDPRFITKLIRNYRSSKDIIHVSNKLFYDDELIACPHEKKSSSFPLLFYAIEGKEQQSSGSKSSYNEDEINQVLLQVKSFIGKEIGDKVISEKDIGIITPFTLQASKIRMKLNDIGLNEVNVGTVEIYQGQEKEVIIITTVRSKTFIHNGVEHIGFLSNPKRFNVALTRAKSFVVVVGSPTALQINKYWRYFLRFCKQNNACHGDPFTIKNDIFYILQELSIGRRIIKSTDLFDETLTILSTDDGEGKNSPRKNDRFKKNILNGTSESNMRFRYII